ncbi:DUF4129 domain-containing protein [Haloarcula sp. S1CR25-12]|uniref:DUF4129 domain-containing protein n=1 Tax=Haloarcula saliterrae TaxID=2950534 RepID=A0ABU2FBW4_9EURY|nr:DUF4129 domain-containing protein [Haloarcula sp. S1CR25-12]MDS0259755.1 DUF4129 domain-containing protein [Haloarcula sp. S1CR25-12]
MNTERILSAGIAVVVVVAVGLSASTLASSMSTDPSEAIDVGYDALPLGADSEGDIAAAAQGVHDRYTEGKGDEQRDVEEDGSDPRSAQRADEDGQRDGEAQAERRGGEPSGDTGYGDRESAQAGQGLSGAQGLAGTGWPLELLLLAAALLALVTVAYRYRYRLRRAVGTEAEASATESVVPDPENDVERAWVELVRRAGVPEPRTRTPRDCARLAVETGFDPSHVDRLRRTFEDVRYGSAPPTDEQESVARETLDRLDGEGS